jgi:hypothetical protein
MGAVTEPGYSYAPPAAPPPGRRRMLTWVVVAWIVVLTGLSVWSVRHDPPTVPEQRTLTQALPELQQAVGAVVAAAGGEGRALVLGELRLDETCRVTPVRQGVDAGRDVTVYVRDGEEHGALDALSADLPEAYAARVSTGRGDTRFTLHADAGNFIGIDAQGAAGSRALTVHVSTGCRPAPSGGVHPTEPSPGQSPQFVVPALSALHVATVPAVTTQTATCPHGDIATTFVYGDLPAPANVGAALQPLASGGAVLYADQDTWTFESGAESLTAFKSGDSLRLTATRGC